MDMIQELRADGVLFAATEEGFPLPIIDVTHPRFHVPEDGPGLEALRARYFLEEARRRQVPQFLLRLMLRSMAKKSRLVRAMFGSKAGFLDGLSTYAIKLGPENLVPPYDHPIDKRFAASPHVAFIRLRMQQVAGMIARGLRDDLCTRESAPLHLVNIGGGPAVDSLNALILLHRAGPKMLKRPVAIHVLDADRAGPHFASNALAVLKADGALKGLDVALDYRAYDWNVTTPLADLLEQLPSGGILAASSEGALFEYGSDEAIVGNLKLLRAADARLVAGSVTAANPARRRMIAASGFKLHPRGAEGFRPLAQEAGFRIARIESNFISDQVLLTPG